LASPCICPPAFKALMKNVLTASLDGAGKATCTALVEILFIFS